MPKSAPFSAIPSVLWLFWSSQTGWATFLLAWTLVIVAMAKFLRPILIKKGADLPLLLIFVGVVGGLVAFGLIGIFVGPVVLADSQRFLLYKKKAIFHFYQKV